MLKHPDRKKIRLSISACLIAICFFLKPAVGTAQDGVSTGQLLRALSLISELTREVKELRNRVEILEYELEQTQERQNQLYDDLDQRLRAESARLSSEADADLPVSEEQPAEPAETESALDEPAPTEDSETAATETTEVPPEPEPEPVVEFDPQLARDAYNQAFQLLRKGKYEDAISEFTSIVESYPTSDLVDDSIYWIAEANYVTENYDTALDAFKSVVAQFPDSQRAPEAMLKIGYIYYNKGEFDSASDYLLEVVDKYPASRSAFSARRRLDKMEREQQQ